MELILSPHPDFTDRQYRVQRELGRNREGGRISYLAERLNNPSELVVIKQFRFLQTDANWQGFKAYEREIQFLRELDHPRIPRYLDSFETVDGFCMVQEYKDAPTLVDRQSFNPSEIKEIALSILEILVYLQQRIPPIFHRDLKLENILVDDRHQAYLIDFGLARLEHQEVAVSSIVAGTPGFMPPEELFNRTLTKASDLYSLGATIVCLLTHTRSTDISDLLDDNYRLQFTHLTTGLNPVFIDWLQQMVAPNLRDRIPNAKVAMERLQAIDIEDANCIEVVPIPPQPTTSKPLAMAIGSAILLSIFGLSFMSQTPDRHSTPIHSIATNSVIDVNTGRGWFDTIKPRCNAVEATTAMSSTPPPPGWEARGYMAACYTLAGKIEAADETIATLDPNVRTQAVNIVFEIGHPVADAGDDRSAGPIMELVLKFDPQNYMAMYHAGMSAYALNDLPLSKRRLDDFLVTYPVQDGWTNNARVVLEKIDKGIANGVYPKDP
jgi:serine/threonine protein kinase